MASDRVVRRRVDAELVRRGLVRSREEAREVVSQNRVQVDGAPVRKPSTLVMTSQRLLVGGPPPRFVSRGGEKLSHALGRFGIDVTGLRVLDAGISTGGFTDCLLQAGAREVVGVDVGYGQLAERLRQDPRVVLHERTNVRSLDAGTIAGGIDLLVADLSFISLRSVLPVVLPLIVQGGGAIILVKPQFEVGRAGLGKGGVVRDPAMWRHALEGVVGAVEELGWAVVGLTVSPLRGAAGNVEFLAHLRRADGGGGRRTGPTIDAVIAEAVAVDDGDVAADGAGSTDEMGPVDGAQEGDR